MADSTKTATVAEREIFCRRCKYFLATVECDGQYLNIQNINIFQMTTLICSNCGRPYRWNPTDLGPRGNHKKDLGLYDTDTLEKEFNL